MELVSDRVENIMWKEENAGSQHYYVKRRKCWKPALLCEKKKMLVASIITWKEENADSQHFFFSHNVFHPNKF